MIGKESKSSGTMLIFIHILIPIFLGLFFLSVLFAVIGSIYGQTSDSSMVSVLFAFE